MPKEQVYSAEDIVNTYISAQRPDHIDFKSYYFNLLAALEKVFDITITNGEGVESNKRAIYLLFQSTIASFISIRTPGSGFMDSSLILKQLETSSIEEEVGRSLNKINMISEQNKLLHLELIRTLFSYLYNPRIKTVTSNDLFQVGFDDALEPNPDDYEY